MSVSANAVSFDIEDEQIVCGLTLSLTAVKAINRLLADISGERIAFDCTPDELGEIDEISGVLGTAIDIDLPKRAQELAAQLSE